MLKFLKKKQKVSKSFPLELVWQTINRRDSGKQYTLGDVTELIQVVFPGINFWWSELPIRLGPLLLAPALKTMFPKLDQLSLIDARKQFGPTIFVTEKKSCRRRNGYEWEGWPEYRAAIATATR